MNAIENLKRQRVIAMRDVAGPSDLCQSPTLAFHLNTKLGEAIAVWIGILSTDNNGETLADLKTWQEIATNLIASIPPLHCTNGVTGESQDALRGSREAFPGGVDIGVDKIPDMVREMLDITLKHTSKMFAEQPHRNILELCHYMRLVPVEKVRDMMEFLFGVRKTGDEANEDHMLEIMGGFMIAKTELSQIPDAVCLFMEPESKRKPVAIVIREKTDSLINGSIYTTGFSGNTAQFGLRIEMLDREVKISVSQPTEHYNTSVTNLIEDLAQGAWYFWKGTLSLAYRNMPDSLLNLIFKVRFFQIYEKPGFHPIREVIFGKDWTPSWH